MERLVPSGSQNLTQQSNTSVLGLSDFEMKRIGVAASVSFLGGVIQVRGAEMWGEETEAVSKAGSWCFSLIHGRGGVCLDG